MPKVLVFAPDAGVTPHYGAMAQLARTLVEQGAEVGFIDCDRFFRRCTSKTREPLGLPREGRADGPCSMCRYISSRVIPAYGLPRLDPAAMITLAADTAIQRLIAATPDHELTSFSFDGLDIGRLVLHDFILARKILNDSNLSPEDFLWLREAIETALQTLLIARRLFLEEGYTHAIFYGQYNQNMVIFWLAQKLGVLCSFVGHSSHLGVDRRQIMFFHEETRQFLFRMIGDWATWGALPLEPADVADVAADMRNRFGSSSVHIYSPPKTFSDADFRNEIGIADNRKTLVVFTSSLDEIFAQNMQAQAQGRPPYHLGPAVFPDQVSWLRFLAAFARRRSDIQVVVRVHPREGANRRENVRSQHLDFLEEALGDSPANLRVVWPSESISSYDLMEIADVVLNAWSYIGMEAARFGVPVIAAFPTDTCQPPNAFYAMAATVSEYEAAINRQLARPPDFQQITQAFRWYHHSTFNSSISVDDVVPTSDFIDIHPYRTPVRAAALARAVLDQRWTMDDYLDARRSRLGEPEVQQAATRTEAEAMRRQLRSLIRFLLLGEENAVEDYRLTVLAQWPEGGAAPPVSGATLYVRDGWCRFVAPDADRVKYSPMAARLGLLAAHSRGGDWAPLFGLVEESQG